MKANNRILTRLLCLAMVFLLALSTAIPAFAAENLTITIKNNKGLPKMEDKQFTAYQLFKGNPHEETTTPGQNDWEASDWNNWTLADVEWGKNIGDENGKKLLDGLKSEGITVDAWPGFFNAEGKNIITEYTTGGGKLDSAADLAAFLVDKDNAFLQEFSRFVLEGSETGAKATGFIIGEGATSTAKNETKPENDTSTITVDDAGYYLIKENGDHADKDAVSEYILAVLGDQTINLKASVPTVDKNIVADDGSGDLLKGDSVGISDTVTYQITGTLPKNFGDFKDYEYYFHDTLSKGLTYDEKNAKMTVTVTIQPKEGDPVTYKIDVDTDKNGSGYEVSYHKLTEADVADDGEYHGKYTTKDVGKTLIDITFSDLKKLMGVKQPGGSDPELIPFDDAVSYDNGNVLFTVTYNVTVNEDAVIGEPGNPNEVYLEYSNDPNHDSTGHTEEKKVIVYSFALDLTKTGSDDTHKDALAGAGFVLSKKVGDDIYYAQFEDVKDDPDDPNKVTGRRLTGWVRQSKEGESDPLPAGTVNVAQLIKNFEDAEKALDNANADTKAKCEAKLQAARDALKEYLLESGDDGKIPVVSGLDAGSYTLTEVITPDGYNTMDPIDFTIAALTEQEIEEEKVPALVELSATLTGDSSGRTDANFGSSNLNTGVIPGTLMNQKAPFLPFTGGVGTTIFYVLGTALIVGAVAYLVIVTKKRKVENA